MSEEYKKLNLSFGERAVGLTFNPSGDPVVLDIKRKCADMIDLLANRIASQPEEAAWINEAIRQMQTAQMWAVKAVTFRA